jgi:hypothetical protein
MHAPISDTANIVRARPEPTASEVFLLHFREVSEDEASDRDFERVSPSREGEIFGGARRKRCTCSACTLSIPMVQVFTSQRRRISSSRKAASFPTRNFLRDAGTPDKVIGYLVGEVFGVLCIDPQQSTMRAHSCAVPVGAALPLDQS